MSEAAAAAAALLAFGRVEQRQDLLLAHLALDSPSRLDREAHGGQHLVEQTAEGPGLPVLAFGFEDALLGLAEDVGAVAPSIDSRR